MKNAFIGYSYQEHVTSLMLAKMDVERTILEIEIEAKVDHKFDDVKLVVGDSEYYFQIKDFDNVSINELIITGDEISIGGKTHKLSSATNVIFFKSIEIITNCVVLDMDAYKLDSIYIVSLNRVAIDQKIEALYKSNQLRKYIIDQFFSECLDNRKLLIKKSELPVLNVFKTYLIEPTVDITRKVLNIENILLIEGKPGVGKSHLVVNLEKQYTNNIVYRFWVSNQDNEYYERLQYNNFMLDFSKKLFGNLKPYAEAEIIAKINELEKTVIIDGLDHVENYNPKDLEAYITFIDNLSETCKVIVLSRPLLRELIWKKQLLGNWNQEQTKKVLNELYHIEEYTDTEKIYKISDGYPILVRYIAEQYKLKGTVPDFETFDSIDKYYEKLIEGEKGKQALSLFLCVRSYIMQSEVTLFLDSISASFVTEFIKEHPYLFELRLNRISLFHDSFITYLRKLNTNYKAIAINVNSIVYSSILEGEKRFLSRFTYFDLSILEKKKIIKKYCSIVEFRKLMNGAIDFEAIQDFYKQIREIVTELSAEDFEVNEYYDLSLIINMVSRDHIFALNGFHYTYCKALLYNGFTFDDFTSSRYLFGMLYYIETNDGSLILNTTSDSHYDTSRFYWDLQNDALEEINFFEKHKKALSTAKIKSLLKDKKSWEYKEIITYILENLFIHNVARKTNKELFQSIKYYMNNEDWKAKSILIDVIADFEIEDFKAAWILKDVRKNLLSLGYHKKDNDYLKLSLKQNILKHKDLGSFDMGVYILNHIRLAMHQNRKIDIGSISLFWTKYYQRKDYTLSTIDKALTVFENHNYVNQLESLKLIIKVQKVSDKGYRGLLADYIVKHPPSIIDFILDNFDVYDLRISWFALPSEYINVIPDRVYNIEVRNVLKENRTDKKVKYEEVENILKSNRFDIFFEAIKFWRYTITIPKGHPDLKFLKAKKIPFNEDESENSNFYSTPDSILNDGIVNDKNRDLERVKILKSFELASLSDGYYTALADTDIYKRYGKEDIQVNIKAILRNAMLGKVKSIDSYHYIWFFPGNVIKILDDNEVIENFDDYFNSFSIFLKLSMFDLKSNVYNIISK